MDDFLGYCVKCGSEDLTATELSSYDDPEDPGLTIITYRFNCLACHTYWEEETVE
jgi:hypothetical protein